ncbi:hypothetical protein AVEN_26307-1 [Araneus ventricosus]|uniref:Uncharacterized protein n=1 Tax=Araneus ventricosus TaxID=182803 RepID=A0A4Y2AM15_ARAVE|nr:hypothetical protein AVEN_26307-1 [Araneus ventricosus]
MPGQNDVVEESCQLPDCPPALLTGTGMPLTRWKRKNTILAISDHLESNIDGGRMEKYNLRSGFSRMCGKAETLIVTISQGARPRGCALNLGLHIYFVCLALVCDILFVAGLMYLTACW